MGCFEKPVLLIIFLLLLLCFIIYISIMIFISLLSLLSYIFTASNHCLALKLNAYNLHVYGFANGYL